MKILIIGGYGTFGGRLVDLLLDRAELELIVGGRDLAKAHAFCEGRLGLAKLRVVQIDRNRPETHLRDLRPDLVVDASGPFQVYGARPYVLVEACIAQGCHYLDLADGADFVAGVAQFDSEAKERKIFVLSGVSSFPVLSAAVVRHLARDMQRVSSIEAAIAPSPYAGVGLNVVKAIASYAGKPVKLLLDGKWTTRAGFFDSRRFVVNVPGRVPLKPIRFGLAEVPDLQVLKWIRPEVQSIWVGAGPTPAFLHRLLWAVAGLVKLRILPSLLALAPIMNFVINTVRWGEHRGGMVVRVHGGEKGRDVLRSWHLLAEGDGGPLIPSMAVAAIIARQLEGIVPEAGARSAHEALDLEHYAPWFKRHGIGTGTRCEGKGQTLYESVMGEAMNRLSPPLRVFHEKSKSFVMTGEAEVTGASNVFGSIVRKIFGFPATGSNVPLQVNIDIKDGAETWQRNFAGKTFISRQWRGRGRYEGLLMEAFGPMSFGLAVEERAGQLHLVPRRWDIFGMPMPAFLMPRVIALEHGASGRFNFDVTIKLPLIGRITQYRGWLA
jgi:Domain of unknown function (DUF4166)/Saccharopine dehydrogenase NADP binding domain